MKIIFLCYPKCTTCQKAKNWLDDNNIEYNANVSIQNYGVSNGDKFDTKLEMITPDTYRYLVHGSISYRLDKGHN